MVGFNAVYHIATLNHWRDVVAEQVPLLAGNRNLNQLIVTVGGNGAEAVDLVRSLIGRNFHHAVYPLNYFEHPAMDAADQIAAHDDLPVLYFHAKGVSYAGKLPLVERWRMVLNRLVKEADHWASFLAASDYDTCGSWLFTNPQLSFFPGNFWLAKAGYLRTLPRYSGWVANPAPLGPPLDRHLAESAINRGNTMRPYLIEGASLNNETWLPYLSELVGISGMAK
jgi:hypothetical protein